MEPETKGSLLTSGSHPAPTSVDPAALLTILANLMNRVEVLEQNNTRTQSDRTIFQKDIQILDAKNIQVGRTSGTMIGTAADQKLGLYGVNPVAQQSPITVPTGTGTAGVDTPARNAIISIIAAIRNIGITN